MMAGVQVTSILDWGQFYSVRALILLTPGVVFGVTTYLLLCRVRSPYVLPCCMVGILTLFFVTLLLSGASLQDARDYGWISPLSHPGKYQVGNSSGGGGGGSGGSDIGVDKVKWR